MSASKALETLLVCTCLSQSALSSGIKDGFICNKFGKRGSTTHVQTFEFEGKSCFSTLLQIKSSFIPPGSTKRAGHVHTSDLSSDLLAGMLPLEEGDGCTP
jgi:hypothetical protein